MIFPFASNKIDPKLQSNSFKDLIDAVKKHPSLTHADINTFCFLCLKRKTETPQMRRREGLIFCNACGFVLGYFNNLIYLN